MAKKFKRTSKKKASEKTLASQTSATESYEQTKAATPIIKLYHKFIDDHADDINLTVREREIIAFFESQWSAFKSPIDFVNVMTVQLFRDTMAETRTKFKQKGYNLDKSITAYANKLVIKKRTRNVDHNWTVYHQSILNTDEIEKNILLCIFIACRNKMNKRFQLMPRTQIFSLGHNKLFRTTVNYLFKTINPIIDDLVAKMPNLNVSQELQLSAIYRKRHEKALRSIKRAYDGNTTLFLKNVMTLAKQSKKVTIEKELLLDSVLFLAGKDDSAALKIYLTYINLHSQSSDQRRKPLPLAAARIIFKTPEQQTEFAKVVKEYKLNKDRKEAFEAVDRLLAAKWRRIKINTDRINLIAEQHAETVQLLNQLLEEDEATELTNNHEQQPIEIISNTIETVQQKTNTENNTIDDLLTLFEKNNLTISKKQLELFAKERATMPNMLIDQINDRYYNDIDDVLIEEDEDNWIATELYFNKIISKWKRT